MIGLLPRPLRHPASTILLVVAVTVFAASRIVDFRTGELLLKVDPAVDRLLPKGDLTRQQYDRAREIFGNDEHIVVVLESDTLYSTDGLTRLQRLTERYEELEGVDRVVSLFTALDIRGRDDELSTEPFVTDVPEDAESLAAIQRSVRESPVYSSILASPDGRATALLVYLTEPLEDEPETAEVREGLGDRLAAIAAEEAGGATIHYGGSPHTKDVTSRLLLSDVFRVVPIGAVLLGVTALAAFRRLRGVVVPLLTILVANAWTLATMTELGVPLNLVTVVVPVLVQTVGFAYAIHVISHFYDLLRGGEVSAETAGRRAIRDLFVPVLLTALTTCAGLASLTLSPMTAVREFGWFSVLGVIYTAIAAATFTPAALQLFRARPAKTTLDDAIDRIAERVARFDLRHRRAIFAMAGVIALLSAVGLARIQINTEFVTNFAPDHQVRRDVDAINAALSGAGTADVVVEADYDDAFKEPRNLLALEALQHWLEAQPEVGATTSIADYVKVINWGFNDNVPEARRIPETTETVTQLLLFGANDELDLVVEPSYRVADVRMRTYTLDSAGMSGLISRLEPRLGELPAELSAHVTGNGALLARAVDDIARTQAESLLFAFALIYLVLAFLLTSFRVGLIALIPNALPVLFYFGMLGWTGVTLNATTGLVACLALGIAVDDTIHFFARFNREARRLGDEQEGMVRALVTLGRPITVTSIALCLGFIVLTTAELKNLTEFGALTAATLGFAWLADVTLTPALCAGLKIVTLWDLLRLDLGPEPTRTIPLFRDLSDRRARIVCLMASLRSFEPGEQVFREGESGEDMLVILDGELRASLPRAEGDLELNVHRRGDVVGEVALQHGKRTANVTAATAARALSLTNRDLGRLASRYPRIGVAVYRNLNRILSDRLASQTRFLS